MAAFAGIADINERPKIAQTRPLVDAPLSDLAACI